MLFISGECNLIYLFKVSPMVLQICNQSIHTQGKVRIVLHKVRIVLHKVRIVLHKVQ